MPTITNVSQTLTTVGLNTTINVIYKATFSPLERFLASKGMKYRERITVGGQDFLQADTVITGFAVQDIPVSDGVSELVVDRNRSKSVLRSSLQEDAGIGDNDEIRCKITIEPIGLPQTVDKLTEVDVLVG